MAPWVLPAASILAGLYAGRGNGGGSEFSEERGRVFGAQADIAEQMRDLYASRIANEERYLGDAMGRVFGYVDETMGRRPDLLYAPGIFEFMPRDVPPPSAPEWVPFGGPERVETVTPPPSEMPPFNIPAEWQDMAKLKPGTDIVPPMTMMPWQYTKLLTGAWDKASDVIGRLKNKLLGTDWTGWEDLSDKDIWEKLWEGEDKPGTSWQQWLGVEDLTLAAALTKLEGIMRDTLQLDELGEPFRQPYQGQYDPAQWMTLQGREISSDKFVPSGEYMEGPIMRVDPATGEVLGPQVPEGGTPLDLPPEITADPRLWARYGDVTDFTRLSPGKFPEEKWRRERRERQTQEDIEEGQYEPVPDEGFVPIRPVSAAEVKRLYDAGLNMEFVNADGSSLTSSEWEAFQAGQGDPVYAKGVHSGKAEKPGLFGDVDYSGIYYLTMDEINALLSGEGDPWTLRGEGRIPQEDLSLPLTQSALPAVSSLPPLWDAMEESKSSALPIKRTR